MRFVLVAAATLALLTVDGNDLRAQGFGDLLKQGQDALKSKQGSGGIASGGGNAAGLSDGEISSGLKEALQVGTEKVVAQLGQSGGFLNDEAIRIPLPGQLEQAKTALSAVGMGDLAEDLEVRMNRAAEQAVPEAQTLFVDAIQEMSISDARGILTGPDDSATQYFQEKMTAPLSERMQPIVDDALTDAGAVKAYDELIGEYSSLPFVGDVQANLNDYVVGKGLDGLFHYVAIQEEQIRTNPAARTTELLQTVFGN